MDGVPAYCYIGHQVLWYKVLLKEALCRVLYTDSLQQIVTNSVLANFGGGFLPQKYSLFLVVFDVVFKNDRLALKSPAEDSFLEVILNVAIGNFGVASEHDPRFGHKSLVVVGYIILQVYSLGHKHANPTFIMNQLASLNDRIRSKGNQNPHFIIVDLRGSNLGFLAHPADQNPYFVPHNFAEENAAAIICRLDDNNTALLMVVYNNIFKTEISFIIVDPNSFNGIAAFEHSVAHNPIGLGQKEKSCGYLVALVLI